ncbi:hypothetical protein [Fusobacterium sp. HMSC073F01]|uniref:hypothetical protein n=1 Tax=Fusobacterium sp. HMSC073F01 TaxID=1739251 RepID=UPI0008A22BFF|nr:hypothetical protein [Fusobacterium sp. HMSC073F01]OFL94315.1 hypothetical protein HMPREF2747_16050 [Fusobacterium sp. HMSC073F01]
MKKILLVFLLLGLFSGWIKKPNEKEEAEIYYNRGKAKYFSNDFKGSILDYNKAIESDPKFIGAYFLRVLVKVI